jgi:thiol oxidase
MNLLFFNKYINLILLVILGNLRQSLSGPPPANDHVALYNATDKVTVVTYQNFTSTVYHSNTAWLIEFYASWCGHCRSYAQV